MKAAFKNLFFSFSISSVHPAMLDTSCGPPKLCREQLSRTTFFEKNCYFGNVCCRKVVYPKVVSQKPLFSLFILRHNFAMKISTGCWCSYKTFLKNEFEFLIKNKLTSADRRRQLSPQEAQKGKYNVSCSSFPVCCRPPSRDSRAAATCLSHNFAFETSLQRCKGHFSSSPQYPIARISSCPLFILTV